MLLGNRICIYYFFIMIIIYVLTKYENILIILGIFFQWVHMDHACVNVRQFVCYLGHVVSTLLINVSCINWRVLTQLLNRLGLSWVIRPNIPVLMWHKHYRNCHSYLMIRGEKVKCSSIKFFTFTYYTYIFAFFFLVVYFFASMINNINDWGGKKI